MGSLLSKMMDMNKEYVSEYTGESQGFKTPESGWYEATITKSEIKKSAAGHQGMAHDYILEVDAGVSKFVGTWFNICHPNEVCQRIAHEQVYACKMAIGRPSLTEAEHFIDGKLMVKINKRPATENEMANGWCNSDNCKAEVKGYKAIDGAGDGIPFGDTAQPSTPKQETAPVFNWQKKS